MSRPHGDFLVPDESRAADCDRRLISIKPRLRPQRLQALARSRIPGFCRAASQNPDVSCYDSENPNAPAMDPDLGHRFLESFSPPACARKFAIPPSPSPILRSNAEARHSSPSRSSGIGKSGGRRREFTAAAGSPRSRKPSRAGAAPMKECASRRGISPRSGARRRFLPGPGFPRSGRP